MNSIKLPLDCDLTYIENFFSDEEAWRLYHLLIQEYQLDQKRFILDYGDHQIVTDSFKILFADQDLIDRNSHPEHIHGKSYVWCDAMQELKTRVQKVTGKAFPLAMALYYPDGNYFAEFHSDQKTSGDATILPSLSLGAERIFTFRHQTTEETYTIELAHGSLLIMGKGCQDNYMHSLPKDPDCQEGRINITFRDANFQ
jgi:hypothetical protein